MVFPVFTIVIGEEAGFKGIFIDAHPRFVFSSGCY